MRLTGVMVLLACAGPVQAALPCDVTEQMVVEAAMVMQISVRAVDEPLPESTTCRVEGEIVRSFRGPLTVGTVIETQVPCRGGWTNADGEPVVMVGADIYTDRDAMLDAPVIELHIADTGGPAGYGEGVVLLEAATDAPVWQPECLD